MKLDDPVFDPLMVAWKLEGARIDTTRSPCPEIGDQTAVAAVCATGNNRAVTARLLSPASGLSRSGQGRRLLGGKPVQGRQKKAGDRRFSLAAIARCPIVCPRASRAPVDTP